MHSLTLDPDKKQKEWKIIQSIAKNNNFPRRLLDKLNHQIQSRVDHTQNEKKHNKIWTTFTYHSPQIRKITNLFKNTNIAIAFKATTRIQQLIRPKTQIQTTEHEKSGIYEIICNTCHKSYVGQTSHKLNLRFREHVRYIKNNDPRSAYALHKLNCRHEYGNINYTMTLLEQINKPSLLLPYEQMYIQIFRRNNELIPEQHPNEHNPMFELL
jgi:phosphoribulokinase